jgi:hypothetical protein
MGLQRAGMAVPGGDLCLEALQPPAGDGVEAQPRRGWHPARLKGRDQIRAAAARLAEVVAGSAEVKPPGAAGAYGEVAVRLPVYAALDAGPARPRPVCHGCPPARCGLTYG